MCDVCGNWPWVLGGDEQTNIYKHHLPVVSFLISCDTMPSQLEVTYGGHTASRKHNRAPLNEVVWLSGTNNAFDRLCCDDCHIPTNEKLADDLTNASTSSSYMTVIAVTGSYP